MAYCASGSRVLPNAASVFYLQQRHQKVNGGKDDAVANKQVEAAALEPTEQEMDTQVASRGRAHKRRQ